MIAHLKNSLKTKDKFWLVGYIAAIILPFGLIFDRLATELCVAIIGLVFLASSFCNKEWKWLHDPAIKIAFIAWLWLLFISIYAYNITASFVSAATWLRYLLLYAALRHWLLIRADALEFLGRILALMLFLVVVDTLWQYVFGISITGNIRTDDGRLTGPLDNVKVGIFMAKMLFPALGIFLFFAAFNNRKSETITAFILLITAIATILLTGERTAFLSVIIGFFVALFLLAVSVAKFRPLLFSVALLVILIFAILFNTQSWVQTRITDFYMIVSNYPLSEYGQLHKAGLLIGSENWQSGAGLKGFRELCHKLFVDGIITTENLHPHNLYIEWFAETGFIGFLLFISFVICISYQVAKIFLLRKDEERIITAFTIAALLVNFFPFMPTQSIFSNWPAILLWYSSGVAMAAITASITAGKNHAE